MCSSSSSSYATVTYTSISSDDDLPPWGFHLKHAYEPEALKAAPQSPNQAPLSPVHALVDGTVVLAACLCKGQGHWSGCIWPSSLHEPDVPAPRLLSWDSELVDLVELLDLCSFGRVKTVLLVLPLRVFVCVVVLLVVTTTCLPVDPGRSSISDRDLRSNFSACVAGCICVPHFYALVRPAKTYHNPPWSTKVLKLRAASANLGKSVNGRHMPGRGSIVKTPTMSSSPALSLHVVPAACPVKTC
ncbi:hypothetical protein Tco_0662284 [Tanacetum coccineum]